MNNKIFRFREEILKRYLQRYTLEMIRLWLQDTYDIFVCKSSISRSIKKSLSVSKFNQRLNPDEEYLHYRLKVNSRFQVRNYKRRLSGMIGVIEHLHLVHGYSGGQIFEQLTSDGLNTSLSSVYRALRFINGRQENYTKESEANIFKANDSGSNNEQSYVQLQSVSQPRYIPQL